MELQRVDAVSDLLDAEPPFEHARLYFDHAFGSGVNGRSFRYNHVVNDVAVTGQIHDVLQFGALLFEHDLFLGLRFDQILLVFAE